MKAKYFTKLRSKLQYYEVEMSWGLFGDFFRYSSQMTVLAYSHKNACERYNKRKYNHKEVGGETSENWARYKVKLADKISHERHYKYFR